MTPRNSGSRRSTIDRTHAPSEPSRQDAAQIDHPAPNNPAQRRADKPPSTNLHLPRSPLIGREHEVATVQRLLLQHEVGLLTLSGPGGVGKTRLAMQVAATLLDHFVDGVYFVSLAPIRDPNLVIVAIAEVLGIREAGGQPLLEALQSYLQHRQMLLVLDNFEQVVAAAPLLASLLAGCGGLKLLVTSRATLHLYGEQEFPVPPLALPDPKRLKVTRIEEEPPLMQVASVTLFVQRAMAVQPNFALTTTNSVAVGEICIALEGLPLAIELAVTKLKLFSPPTLLARLQQRLTVLTGGPHDVPARQRTLRDEIAWSYELLTASEQALFRRLSAFAGGFSLEAAQAVCNPVRDLGDDVFEGVAALLDQNLLKPMEQETSADSYALGAQPRFGMLETMREYALEQLIASGEAEAVCSRHASFFLALAEVKDQPVAQLALEHDNLRAAMAWSLAEAGRAEMALRLVGVLADFWVVSGYYSEGRRWAEAALALTTPDHTEARAKVLLRTAKLSMWQGDHPAVHVRIEEGMALARELGAKVLIYDGLVYLGWIAHGQHDHAVALAQLNQALTIARELENKQLIGETLLFLGGVVYDEHDYVGAQSLYEEGLALIQEVGDNWSIADALHFVGQAVQAQGDDARAAAIFRESLARWRASGVLEWQGVVHSLESLAALYVGQGQFEDAARLFGAAEKLREVLRGDRSGESSTSAIDKHPDLRGQLGERAFAAAWAAGRHFAIEEAVDYALALPDLFGGATSPVESGPRLPDPVTYPAGLTLREVEVLQLLAQGLTYIQIAEKLVVSRRTVNAHVSSIYSKLDVHSRAAATRFAIDHHLM